VSALKDINLCLKYINKKHGNKDVETGYFYHNDKKEYIWDLPEDMDVFKMLWQGKTETVFQLNSTTATPLVKKIKPESVLDCAVITSLGRPGPLDFIDEKTGRNMAEEYAYRKAGLSKGDLPILEQLIPETYGVLVFQEQVTKIARELGQMSVIDAENVRIGMGKKKIKLLNSLKPQFIKGASQKVGEELAEKVWSMMATFARYGFNKSHAVAYSVISYACAFLKHHYPLEWWAAVLSNADDKEINEVFYKYVKDMVLPPDVNTSTEQMEVDYNINKIRNKLSVISRLGETAAENIIDKRPYKDLKDFVEKGACGPALTRKLVYVGALDSLFEPGLEDIAKLSDFLGPFS
jgi:DNA polymerase-3 subunit alpha